MAHIHTFKLLVLKTNTYSPDIVWQTKQAVS
jgi:hypothetical protein